MKGLFMSDNKSSCLCASDEKIVLTCSGASDVGYICDQVSRKLSRHKVRKMSCLALVASADQETVNDFKNKDILVIDGCTEDCGKKIMAKAGIDNYQYVRITDWGYEKGKTPTTQSTIEAVYDRIVKIG
jgi:uncharacterized metal-binding protein